MLNIADAIHSVLKAQPGGGRNAIAIDTMRGKNSTGEIVDILCKTNRRLLRISAYDLQEDHLLDPNGILWLGINKKQSSLQTQLEANKTVKLSIKKSCQRSFDQF